MNNSEPFVFLNKAEKSRNNFQELNCHKISCDGVYKLEPCKLTNQTLIIRRKMKMNLRKHFCGVLVLAIISLTGVVAFAQDKTDKQTNKDFCQNWGNYNSDKVVFHEVREMTLPATNLLTVDGRRNGGINVKGSERRDVLVRACVQAWGTSEEVAGSLAKSIRIETGSVIRAESATEDGWSVSYEIHVPRSMNLKLTTYNGGIGISGVEGNMDFEAHNGGVSLNDVAGNVKGRTTNGGLSITLTGNSWRGAGLDVETKNGGIRLSLPETYSARIETGTVNGGFNSDINGLKVEEDNERGRNRNKRITADLNGGGAPVRVITTNGGVNISSNRKSE